MVNLISNWLGVNADPLIITVCSCFILIALVLCIFNFFLAIFNRI